MPVNDVGPDNGLIPHPNPLSGGSSSETLPPIPAGEVLIDFTTKRAEIDMFRSAGKAILDPRLFPGFTPREAFELLIKGRKLNPDDFKNLLDPDNPDATTKLRSEFPKLGDQLVERNKLKAINEIWRAEDVDDFTKLAMQWEIQDPHALAQPEWMAERAERVADYLRNLDKALKDAKGHEVLVRYDNIYTYTNFLGLVVSDGTGISFAPNEVADSDEAVGGKILVLSGKSAFSQDRNFTYVIPSEGLRIPFNAREALKTAPDEKDWDLETSSRSYHGREFAPDRLIGVVFEDEMLALKKTGAIHSEYDRLKEAINRPTPDSPLIENLTPQGS